MYFVLCPAGPVSDLPITLETFIYHVMAAMDDQPTLIVTLHMPTLTVTYYSAEQETEQKAQGKTLHGIVK